MKMITTLSAIFAVLSMVTWSAQGESNKPVYEFETVVQDQVILDSLLRWEERVYLHMDRNRLDPGEALFFKAYVYNAPTQRRLSPSGVLRLELRDSQSALVATQYHPIREGTGTPASWYSRLLT